jgi:hypothetical protein
MFDEDFLANGFRQEVRWRQNDHARQFLVASRSMDGYLRAR